MAANVTEYCLKEVTDYLGFESLMNDLMNIEFQSSIIPLGGYKDKGRDAITTTSDNKNIVFCYSVREDWYPKLIEDSNSLIKNEIAVDKQVFCTTSNLTATEFDRTKEEAKKRYGWDLEIYDLKRIRSLLETTYERLIRSHPNIFNPEFFQNRTLSKESSILVVFEDECKVLSEWLTKKLLNLGYYCYSFEKVDLVHFKKPSVSDLLRNHINKVIYLKGSSGLINEELKEVLIIANSINEEKPNFLYTCTMQENITLKETKLVIPFEKGWNIGLNKILERLKIEAHQREESRSKILLQEILNTESVTDHQEEKYFLNTLHIKSVPENFFKIETGKGVFSDEQYKIKETWAYRRINNTTFLSFSHPPQSFANGQFNVSLIKGLNTIDGIDKVNLQKELIRKEIHVFCIKKGFKYCQESRFLYLDTDSTDRNRISFKFPSGQDSWVSPVGQRSYYSPNGSVPYLYFLAIQYKVVQSDDGFELIIRPRYRLCDIENKVLPKRTYVSRRKHLTKTWFNRHWFARFLALVEFLKEESDLIEILPDNQLNIDGTLTDFDVDISICDEIISKMKKEEIEDEEDNNS